MQDILIMTKRDDRCTNLVQTGSYNLTTCTNSYSLLSSSSCAINFSLILSPFSNRVTLAKLSSGSSLNNLFLHQSFFHR